jgi:hypothetical protein
MVHLGGESQVDAPFGLFGDSANLDRSMVCAKMYHRLRIHFGCTRLYPKLTRLKWMLILVCLVTVLILTQDRCTICTERTIGSEIISNAPNGSPQ